MSDTTKEVSGALVEALSELQNPTFDSVNPHFNSKFLSLAGMLNAVKPVLSKYGLVMLQPASTMNGMVQVQTVFLHVSGQQIAFPALGLPISDKTSAQACGAMVTYLRRFSACSALGVAGESDDDANALCPPPADMYPPKAAAQPVRRSAPVDAPQAVPASGGGGGSPKPSQARTAAPSGSDGLPDGQEVDMEATVTFLEVKDGVGRNGKPYRKARVGLKPITGGEAVFASGFGASMIAVLTEAKETRKPLLATVKKGQYGVDLVHVGYAQPAAAQIGDDSDIPF